MHNLDFEQPVTEIEEKIATLEAQQAATPSDTTASEIAKLKKEREETLRSLYAKLTAWQTVKVARHFERPLIHDFIQSCFTDFVELHGDRLFGDDISMIGGFATLEKFRCMVIGHNKGRAFELREKTRNGQAMPEGYRKALRLMKLAEKFHLPVITFIDTPGAYPGVDAEERGQSEAIARNMMEMSILRTPIIAMVTGEGGSGGAIGIGVGDSVLMLSNSIYSVISPEGCASILWRDGTKAPEAAEALKVTAKSLLELKVIDEIIPEPLGGAHRDPDSTMKAVRKTLLKHLKNLTGISPKKLHKRRIEKYARIGRFR